MIREEDFMQPRQFRSGSYLPAGIVFVLTCMVMSIITLCFRIYINTIPPQEWLQNENLLSFHSILNYITIPAYFAVIFIFRHYLLNFNLPTIRKILVLYICVYIVSILSFFFEPHFRSYVYNHLGSDIGLHYGLITIIASLPSIMFTAIFTIIMLYIGIKLYKYKHDYVGGLKILGQAFIISEIGEIFMWIIKTVSSFFISPYSGLYVSINSISAIVNTGLWIYVLYCMYKVFAKAQEYALPETQEKE
jgi:hypothetical protein